MIDLDISSNADVGAPDFGDHMSGGDGTDIPAAAGSQGDTPQVDEAQKALIAKWVERIKKAKTGLEKGPFKRMKKCRQIAKYGAVKQWIEEQQYVVPVANRQVNISVAALYAKNPTIVAKRRKKLMFQLWDGSPETLMQAVQQAAPPVDPQTGQPLIDPLTGQPKQGDPQAQALIQEVQRAKLYDLMTDRVGKTLEILCKYFLDEQACSYKEELKQLVRRTKTDGVSYCELNFQRLLKPRPDIEARIQDITSKVAAIQANTKKIGEGDATEDSPEAAELQNMLADLQTQRDIVTMEGPVLDFFRGDELIVDRSCVHLKTLAGAGWIAREFARTADQVQEVYGVDIGKNFISVANKSDPEDSKARIWAVQDIRTQETFTICEGFDGYLKAPAPPDVDIPRFWTIYPLVFNEDANDEDIYPLSDVWMMMFPQQEYNQTRQSLREHRRANRPKYVYPQGRLHDADLDKLVQHPANALIGLKGLAPGDDVGKLVQRFPMVNIDPNLYEVNSVFSDIQRSVGSQEADLGSTSGGTATESSIAEQGRSTTQADQVDDLDTFLTALANGMGALLLREMSKEMVTEIVGPGAVWPDSPPSREDVAKDLYLDIRAGSSGRPNQAADLAKLERAIPILMQVPGVKADGIMSAVAPLLDLDVDEIYEAGLPSITAMNAAAGNSFPPSSAPVSTPTSTLPAEQGPMGAQNAPAPAMPAPGPQPMFPAPMPQPGYAAPGT